MTADKRDLPAVLAELLRAAFDYNTIDANLYAERAAEHLGLVEFEPDGHDGDQGRPFLPDAGTVEAGLRKALGIPGPRTVSYDMGDKARYDVLTGALEMLASYQRHEARAEGPNGTRRLEWAALASAMLHEADTARNAEDVKEARDGA